MRRTTSRSSLVLATCLTLSLIGCGIGDDIRREAEIFGTVQTRVANNFRDPNSTQFRYMRFGSPGFVCGEVNAKNGFGAYVGFVRFYSDTLGNAVVEIAPSHQFRTHYIASCDSLRFPTQEARDRFIANEDSARRADTQRFIDSMNNAANGRSSRK